MFDIGFFKAQPTEWVRHYAGGKVAREGTGLSFYFFEAQFANRGGAAFEPRCAVGI